LGFAGGFTRRIYGSALLSPVFFNIIISTTENRLLLQLRPKLRFFRAPFSTKTNLLQN
jgi:hypothetical protein